MAQSQYKAAGRVSVSDLGTAITDKPDIAEPATNAEPYAWYGLSVLVVVYILNFVDRQILSILANDIKADLNLTDSDLGFLYGTAFAVFYALFGIPLGRLADNWNRVRLLTVGLTLWSAMTALSGFAKNGVVLTVARIGVGVGEATASPSAYSLISDWFPKRMRATALAIYSSGLYLGGGISLFIGALVVEKWNAAFPGGGPMGLVGWQAAFLVVGIPGLLLALLVATLREPARGAIDGLVTPPHPQPFKGFFEELLAVIPPLTLIGAARRGARSFLTNIFVLLVIYAVAYALSEVTTNPGEDRYLGMNKQWLFVGVGVYAVYSWATNLRTKDPATFALIWRSPAFLCTIMGYGCVAFISYAASYWAAPYVERVLEIPKTEIGLLVGGPAAVAGFLGVILGGRMADWLRTRNPAGRILVVAFGMLAPVIPFYVAFTTASAATFYLFNFIAGVFVSSALGAAAATTQDLVLPRMRGTATATFFLATTLFGLALGPYMAGQVSTATGDLATGVLSTLAVVPFGIALLIAAYRLVPQAERTLVERAKAAGEAI
jgi:MFS family permease